MWRYYWILSWPVVDIIRLVVGSSLRVKYVPPFFHQPNGSLKKKKKIWHFEGFSITVFCFNNWHQFQDDFIASVLNSGILVYLTSEFLAEIYQGILVTNIMGEAGFGSSENPSNPLFSSCTLINLLTGRFIEIPLTIHHRVQHFSQPLQMSAKWKPPITRPASCLIAVNWTLPSLRILYWKIHAGKPVSCCPCQTQTLTWTVLTWVFWFAGLKFARRLLTCFWDSFLYVYSNGISSFEVDSDNHSVSLTLEGLENAAKLANSLGKYLESCWSVAPNIFTHRLIEWMHRQDCRIGAGLYSLCWHQLRAVAPVLVIFSPSTIYRNAGSPGHV